MADITIIHQTARPAQRIVSRRHSCLRSNFKASKLQNMGEKKMRSLMLNLLAVALLLFGFVVVGAQQPSAGTTESPAARRGRELIQFINSGDRVAAAVYIKENYGP